MRYGQSSRCEYTTYGHEFALNGVCRYCGHYDAASDKTTAVAL